MLHPWIWLNTGPMDPTEPDSAQPEASRGNRCCASVAYKGSSEVCEDYTHEAHKSLQRSKRGTSKWSLANGGYVAAPAQASKQLLSC